jgi:transposase
VTDSATKTTSPSLPRLDNLIRRWIVERTFAHLMRTRRLARDYERRTASAEAMVYWSMTMVMTRRLAR